MSYLRSFPVIQDKINLNILLLFKFLLKSYSHSFFALNRLNILLFSKDVLDISQLWSLWNTIKDSGIKLDKRGNVEANDIDYKTNIKKVFVSGDMRRGQSLVVWAIKEGRQVAHNVDKFLMGNTKLPFWR